jgi:hypothetical protein
MSKIDEAIKESHNAHEQHIDGLIEEQDIRLNYIYHQDTEIYQSKIQTLNMLQPFWQTSNSWLTIADYNGFEANYLQQKGQDVTASDISDTFLKEACKRGGINKFQRINAEQIDYENGTFEYVSCREAFHHFPRAYLGLYEMVRVSSKAAIIIEPLDVLLRMPELMFLKNVLDRFNRKWIDKIWKNHYSFETVGNYVFKISEREIEKMAMGIGLPYIAFKEFNAVSDTNPKKARRRIKFRNLLCHLHLIPYSFLCCVLFKQSPDKDVIQAMKQMGYKIIPLPPNPYL